MRLGFVGALGPWVAASYNCVQLLLLGCWSSWFCLLHATHPGVYLKILWRAVSHVAWSALQGYAQPESGALDLCFCHSVHLCYINSNYTCACVLISVKLILLCAYYSRCTVMIGSPLHKLMLCQNELGQFQSSNDATRLQLPSKWILTGT